MHTASPSTASRFNSIQAILSVILLMMTTVIFAGFMLVYYETTKVEMDREINDLTEFFANHLSTSLIKPLWDMDTIAIKGITEATMKEKQVYAILVTDNLNSKYNKARDEQWQFIDAEEVVFKGEYVRRKREIIKDDAILGAVEVCLTPKFMRKKLRDAINKMLITLVILNSLLFLTLFFSIREIIISPIKDTASSLGRISRGDIPNKITGKYKGEFNQIRDSMNMLIEATDETIVTAEKIASGNLTAEVRERSEQDRMMMALNRMIQKLNDIMKETDGMIQAVGKGRMNIRGNADAFEGGWRDLVVGVNNVISALKDTIEENSRLSAEIDVARRLQQMILPREEELGIIKGLDIVGFMKPADEVGGDYYDILRYDGTVKIGIGDVTGHGLESGVVMLMTQTAVRTLLFSGEADPVRFLSVLNRVIYDNVQRMCADKSLTLAMVDYKDGQVKLSGQHEEMIVVRENGKVELVDTIDLGFPIGLDENISDFVDETVISLKQGDGVVLYSDGITEAENMNKELYGLERLCDVISHNWHGSAEDIKQAVVEDVQKYIGKQKVYDDLTLVVLKQK